MAQKLTAAKRRAFREEAEEWDQLSDEDFARLFDEGKPVHVRLRRPPPKTLTVALDTQTLNRLRRVARRKQVGPRVGSLKSGDLAILGVAGRTNARLDGVGAAVG